MGDLRLAASTGPIRIRPGEAGRLIVAVPYTPERVAKLETIAGRRWHPKEQYWTVPHTEGVLGHLLALFAGELIEVEPALRPVRAPDYQEPQHASQALGEGEKHRVFSGSIPKVAPNPKLLDRVRQAIRARHLSPNTEAAYVGWIRRFIFFHGKRHPAEMGGLEVKQFLTHLAVQDRVAASTQNQALAALLFLYDNVLNRPLGQIEGVVRARRPRRLPVVLNRQEVQAVFHELEGTPRLVCMLLYGSGLRLVEALRLRVKAIDFSRDLYPCAEPRRKGCAQSDGQVLSRPVRGGVIRTSLAA